MTTPSPSAEERPTRAELLEALANLVEGGECIVRVGGYCYTHHERIRDVCPHKRGQELLALASPRPGEEEGG